MRWLSTLPPTFSAHIIRNHNRHSPAQLSSLTRRSRLKELLIDRINYLFCLYHTLIHASLPISLCIVFPTPELSRYARLPPYTTDENAPVSSNRIVIHNRTV
ncbi:hypothetical protein VTL71DRAFT_13141 [Oculimacula yallundae]|uniref:Uncharacterized protein n=1 Tax=Oculimacula yallundae TaxID=86028 RepID=A0ABR4CPK5_9HELO